ncbi:MAG: hypothetical protein R3F61_37590 [Myxococcota bacterium]
MSVAFADPVVAVVLVDREARDSGYALEIDGWLVDDALPVDVAKGEVLKLVDPEGNAEALDLAPGEAWLVTGSKGEAWMSLLDEEVRTDLIAVRGDDAAIDALATALDARVVEHEGSIYLSAEDILLHAGWVEDDQARRLDEVGFVTVQDAPPTRTPIRRVPAGLITRRTAETPERVKVSGVLPASAPAAVPSQSEAVTPAPVDVPTPEQAQAAERTSEAEALMERSRERYAGVHLCQDDVIWLGASGVWGARGANGQWFESSPGVVRLESFDGELWWKAAFRGEKPRCQALWNPTNKTR